ncbi:MAG TPA: Asp-tRNA(Asn)/Glu-tRNA(Gln) amidotransferase subunit GatB [Dehalococcoidia bacterium]|nr:Asp-tRNA(Asn)/Glu-tRNA(Gln) amidotransferase subunit GatB [Dehalococcoidia bacterium]
MIPALETAYEVVIGLEVHAQVTTKSKMFCRCSADYSGAEPNTHVCPICMGMPGVLPVINAAAVEATIRTGLALHCEIPPRAKFDRKNYPYPDLMKGYQISEYDMPLCRNGYLDIEVDGVKRRIRINRVHLEEDTARLLHRTDETGESYSLLDINRAGMPLMEIVTEPDARSPAEAVAYLTKLRQILRYIGVSDADMEKGSFRCEPNLSLRPRGSQTFGAKVELKNLNSFRAALRAMEFEVARQARLLDEGKKVESETRGWREDTGETASQRSKEEAHDYRYFPEPDLPPIAVSREWVERLRRSLPELPYSRRARFVEEYGLSEYEAGLLTESRPRADYYEAVVARVEGADVRTKAKLAANWMLGDLSRLLNDAGIDVDSPAMKLSAADFASLLSLLQAERITGSAAKEVLRAAFETGARPEAIIAERGLGRLDDTEAVAAIVRQVIEANPRIVADYRSGKVQALQALIGQVMRQTRGRANATEVRTLLESELGPVS